MRVSIFWVLNNGRSVKIREKRENGNDTAVNERARALVSWIKNLSHCYHNVTGRRIIFLYNILITQLSIVALLPLICIVGIHVAMRTMNPHSLWIHILNRNCFFTLESFLLFSWRQTVTHMRYVSDTIDRRAHFLFFICHFPTHCSVCLSECYLLQFGLSLRASSHSAQ